MQCLDTAKPAPAAAGKPASEIVGFDGLNEHLNINSVVELQVLRLTRRCAVDADMAVTLAPMIFGVIS